MGYILLSLSKTEYKGSIIEANLSKKIKKHPIIDP